MSGRRLRGWLALLLVWGLLAAGCSPGAPGGEGGPPVEGSAPAPPGGEGSSPVGGSAPAPPVGAEGGFEASGASGGVAAPSSTAVPAVSGGDADAVPALGLGGVLSVEGLGRLRRVLGDEGLAGLAEEAELLAETGPLWREGDPFEAVVASYAPTRAPARRFVGSLWMDDLSEEMLGRLASEEGFEELLGRLAGEEGFLTEEGLGWLAYSHSLEGLLITAGLESEEELSESAELYRNVAKIAFEVGRDSDYSDEQVKARAFFRRAEAGWDEFGVNDVSTSLGAFCWAVLHPWNALSWSSFKVTPEEAVNLRVWHLEREASERGIDLPWETGPVDGNVVARRALLEVTAPGVRGAVFGPGLPPVLRPGAEGLYRVYDELLAAPVYRVRPTVEELSGYRRVSDLTGEEIAEIWPEEFEIRLRKGDLAKVEEARAVFLRDDEVRGLLNAECGKRTFSERFERSCPEWMRSFFYSCVRYRYRSERADMFSCPVFPSEEALESGGILLNEDCVLLLDEEELRGYILDMGGDEDIVEKYLRRYGGE